MRPRTLLLASALVATMACSLSGGSSSGSPTPAGSPLGQLDAQVAMPAAFPSDVPIYPNARLTAAAGFPSSTSTSWGMEWETLDSVAKVQAWYAQSMSKGDWTITVSATAPESFAATFARKSNSRSNGTLAAGRSAGVTRIQMSLLSAPGS